MKSKRKQKLERQVANSVTPGMEYATNGRRITDIEDSCKAMPTTHVWRSMEVPSEEKVAIREVLPEMMELLAEGRPPASVITMLQKKHHRAIKPRDFTKVYLEEMAAGRMTRSLQLENALISSRCRGISGVSVITVFLSPYPDGQAFSCKWNCAYCPNEPGQPRSYLFGEPGVLRANQNGFDCVKQMLARIESYRVNGHPTDKFEVLILGGTIHSYPKEYLNTFMRDIYYAANICDGPTAVRPALTLAEEKAQNTASEHRVIGVTVETRPDCITPAELRDFRRWGVTRVQIGVQHTDDDVLRAVNRGCSHKHTVAAMKLLKDNCFKVDIHIMPNLPGSTPAKDIAMMDVVLNDLHPDQVKVYPCETTPFTKILEDYKKGSYVPYSNDELTEVVLYWKTRVHPWIRNNRIVRDIPDSYIVDGVKTSSQRCEFKDIMKARGLVCNCIRCREAGRFPNANPVTGELVVRTYEAQGGTERFISWESKDRTVLFGFLRLRFVPDTNTNTSVFPELTGAALIRELHVYGRTISADTATGTIPVAQHLGIGTRLLREAERISMDAGYRRIAVISGVGVQNYYARFGYASGGEGNGDFMIKSLERPQLPYWLVVFICAMCLLIFTTMYLFIYR